MMALMLGPVAILLSTYIPLVPVADYRWPAMGIGGTRSEIAAIAPQPVGRLWWHRWGHDCAEGINSEYGATYVPMLKYGWVDSVLLCNDGRPLLVGNEPEDVAQGNLTPEQQAEALHQALTHWTGPVFCCGWQAQHLPHVRATIAAYRARYGEFPPSRLGVQVHVYQAGVYAPFADLVMAAGMAGQGIIVSECCVLGVDMPDSQVIGQAQRILGELGGARSVAWFCAHDEVWPASNMLHEDGRLTPVGEWWLNGNDYSD